MNRSALALLLLAAFLFGWVAGPHPCHEAAAGERVSGHPSCHEAAPSAAKDNVSLKVSVKVPGCCDVACPHACHMVAVLSVEPVVLAAAPLSRKPAERAGRNAPPVAFGIDHVPLA